MQIFSSSDYEEYVGWLGDLTEKERDSVELRLTTASPRVRFRVIEDESWFPPIRRYSIKIHRDDQNKVYSVCGDFMGPKGPRIFGNKKEVAALVRQWVRASQAEDAIALMVTQSELCRKLQWMLERFFSEDPLVESIKFAFDGIQAPNRSRMNPPLGSQFWEPYSTGKPGVKEPTNHSPRNSRLRTM